MKPTQEQIEAALRYSDCKDKRKDLFSLLSYTEQSSSYPIAAMKILAAAYRDQQRELKKIKIENNNLVKDMILHERMSERFQDETERMKEEVDSVNKEVFARYDKAMELIQELIEDSIELRGEREHWKDEPRRGMQLRCKHLCERINNAQDMIEDWKEMQP